MIFYGRSILLPSFTTPVFLLRLRRLSSIFSVNSHLTVLRHTPKAEAMLDRPTENQASVHSRKKDSSCLYIHLFHNKSRAQYTFATALCAACCLSIPATPTILYDSKGREHEIFCACPLRHCVALPSIYRPQDGNMARLPGGDPF